MKHMTGSEIYKNLDDATRYFLNSTLDLIIGTYPYLYQYMKISDLFILISHVRNNIVKKWDMFLDVCMD